MFDALPYLEMFKLIIKRVSI